MLDLGRQPLGNGFLEPQQGNAEYFYHLECGFSEDSKLFQLVFQPDPEVMFHSDYAFHSGTSQAMARHFASTAAELIEREMLVSGQSFVVELGSNDGIFLRNFVQAGIRNLGVEPARGVAAISEELGVQTLNEFFSSELAENIVGDHGNASLVYAANVMCHIPDVADLAVGLAKLVGETGIVVFEDPYLGDVVRLNSFDQIYDEHVFLFSALSVREIFEAVGMELVDVQPLRTHGGSMRYFLARKDSRPVSNSVLETIARETAQGLGRGETFVHLGECVARNAGVLKQVLVDLKSAGKSVAAYGATSKSTTVYNYAGIGPREIDVIYDNTPAKQGKLSPGVHIPIMSEDRFVQDQPDYVFLSAWNHSDEIRNAQRSYERAGGKWIMHVPHVAVL